MYGVQMSSQVPYLTENLGPPSVFTVDITNVADITRTLQQATTAQVINELLKTSLVLGMVFRATI